MLKNHPKGLFVLALANMGERFGYYTMLAIFVLFMQAKFGFTAGAAGNIYGIFLAAVYFLPLIGGIIADKLLGYGKTIALGIVIMFFGYLLLAIPTGVDLGAKVMMFGALALIALGTGFFKGNLQALVGNLYDDPKYSKKRDLAFSIFYMCINIGAFFAPSAAEAVSNYFLKQDGFSYNGAIPALAHQLNNGTIDAAGMDNLANMAAEQGHAGAELATFGSQYIESLSTSYNFGFGVACLSLIISIAIFLGFRKYYKTADKTEKQKAKAGETDKMVQLTAKQTKDRLVALGLVFAVVIFFWMAFHQNGLTLTFFARDYTATAATGFTRIGFDVINLALIIVMVYGLFSAFQSEKSRSKIISACVVLVSGGLLAWKYLAMDTEMSILPQIFQQFNPFFVVALTPVSLAAFGALAKRGKEPSAPRKIGIGMFIAAAGFAIMAFGSLGLPTPNELVGYQGEPFRVTPNLLISTYLILTFAELFLSPMGISFVSKVAPPKYKGAMMGCWFAATAIGNYLVSIIGMLWGELPLWILWTILIVLCLVSALFIFSIMKKLENATK